VFDLVILV